jgi:hypothetical protein
VLRGEAPPFRKTGAPAPLPPLLAPPMEGAQKVVQAAQVEGLAAALEEHAVAPLVPVAGSQVDRSPEG